MCAGSGALTIQKWNTNNSLEFVCMEFDKKVISYLLFNLAIRNINAIVLHSDVLSNETFKAYEVKKSDTYGIVKEIQIPKQIKADVCISNPPYNLKWDIPIFASVQPRFIGYEIPPKSNANYAFVLTALHYSDKVTMILPCSVLNDLDKVNFSIRKTLIENNYIESVIINPNNMFECTDVGTCLLTLNKNKKTRKVKILDMRQTYQTEIRDQRGQYGSKSHTNRVYHKTFNIYGPECQELIITTLESSEEIPMFFKAITLEEMRSRDYALNLGKYVDVQLSEELRRPYELIIADINKIVKLRNSVKITINESLAKQIGFDVEKYKTLNSDSRQIKSNLEKIFGIEIVADDYISFSKNKNEFKIEQKDKDSLSVILYDTLKFWKAQIRTMNEQENAFLAELRDAMIPDLMSGKIDVSDTDFI